MNASALALTGYMAWFVILLLTLGGFRVAAVVTANRAPNSFNPNGLDMTPFVARLVRAHANCYESFPWFGGSLLLALATDSTAITNPLALIALACRVGQSSVHMTSVSNTAVNLRFALFIVQVGIVICWLAQFLGKYSG